MAQKKKEEEEEEGNDCSEKSEFNGFFVMFNRPIKFRAD